MNIWVALYFAFGFEVGIMSAGYFHQSGLDDARSIAIGIVSGLAWPVALPVYLLIWTLDGIMNRN